MDIHHNMEEKNKINFEKMEQPKVSVIVPIYNVEKYIFKCVDSLLNQTLKDIEIILVDDESPDNCPQICDKLAENDNRVKVIHKKNAGLGFARNSGLDVAAGEYISFIDSDDFVSYDMLEKLYNVAKKYKADEVRSGVVFYKDGKEIQRQDVDEVTIFRGEKEVKKFVLDLCGPVPEEKRDCKYMMSVWLALHSRKVIEKYHIRFTSERQTLSEDMIFNLDLFPKMERIVCIPDCFYRYRQNPSSLTHNFSIEKYKRYHVFLDLVHEKLSLVFKEEELQLHFLRLSFLYLRNAIGSAAHTSDSLMSRLVLIRMILHDKYWATLLDTYPYYKMEWKHRVYFSLLKKKISKILMIVHLVILKNF